ncbi:MAG: hypothetical protein A3K65_04140 [Euryarchaeota archaeon RBG_16_68_12]|nr:MAG: hypothetical protein A3K65_04140 [Euryarchaeota archaeon RBG_16_68_12]
MEVFYYALRDDEYVVVANPGSMAVDLSDWRLTDREGTVEFPANATLAAGARAVVARNATSYLEDTLDDAEYTYGRGNATPMRVVGRIPQLANDGDEVLLLDPAGAVVDAVAWGGSPYAGSGWSGPPAAKVPQGKRAVRATVAGMPMDTDTASDWDSLRSYGLGQSDLPFARIEVRGSATGFLSPDDSLSVLEGFLDGAAVSIHASLYTLTNPALGASLRAAAVRGVDVRILLEGGPVGGIDEREWALVQRIAAAGGQVRFLADDLANDTMARYRFAHAKYAVIDGRIVAMGSENWGEHGFPAAGTIGNRGWHVAVEDAGLAAYFEDLFRQDFDPRRRDSVAFADFRPALYAADDGVSNGTYPSPIPPVRVAGPFRVTPVIAPDHALRDDALLGLLRSAATSLDVEAFYVARSWGTGPNPYLEAAVDAARRGVRVRVLLDGTSYNIESDDPVDNDDTAAYVNGIALREGLDLEAKIGGAWAHRVAKFHNKGVLVDNGTVFVSSLNWNRNAATNNREVGLIVESAALAEPFRTAFEHDWRDDVTPPVAEAGPDLVAYAGAPVALSAAGSHDDIGIVSYLWDLDGDGLPDTAGRVANVTFRAAGGVRVVLTVEDAWGNQATDALQVTVLAQGIGAALLANPLTLPLVTLLAVNVALVGSWVRRKRNGGKELSEEPPSE